MTDLLSRQITLAARKTILKNSENTRIWLVSGSGGIAMSIHKAFPAAKLFLLKAKSISSVVPKKLVEPDNPEFPVVVQLVAALALNVCQ